MGDAAGVELHATDYAVEELGVCLLTLALSVLFMWTQTVNPFLYYQF